MGFLTAAAVCVIVFVALTLAIGVGMLNPVDQQLAAWARPDEVWGPLQQQVSPIVGVFGPKSMVAILAVTLIIVVLRRRSVRPGLLPVMTGLAGVAIVSVLKVAVGRSDVQGRIIGNGSFPSGHAFAITLTTGLVLMLFWPRPRWWHLAAPLISGLGMGALLVIIGMHWAGDALGSILLAQAMIAGMAAWIIEHPDQTG